MLICPTYTRLPHPELFNRFAHSAGPGCLAQSGHESGNNSCFDYLVGGAFACLGGLSRLSVILGPGANTSFRPPEELV